MKELSHAEGQCCANCETPLQGAYCHACGQSSHSVLRPVHGLAEELAETMLHVDGRILHSLPPLFTRPGFLTLEYFAGRRVRYIPPFRLMFVLCVLCFFLIHLGTDALGRRAEAERAAHATQAAPKPDADTANKRLQQQLAALDATAKSGDAATAAQAAATARQLREHAHDTSDDFSIDVDEPAPSGPVLVNLHWLPQFANARLSLLFTHLRDNWYQSKHGTPDQRTAARERLMGGFFADLPEAMLVLMPVFALLLTLFYAFKRRLFMEHLIVALHSHAFIFLCLLLITLSGMLSGWLKPHLSAAGYVLGLVQTALFVWIPLYLLLSQKRIYRQGWVMTVVKFWFVGWCYLWLLSAVLLLAFVIGGGH